MPPDEKNGGYFFGKQSLVGFGVPYMVLVIELFQKSFCILYFATTSVSTSFEGTSQLMIVRLFHTEWQISFIPVLVFHEFGVHGLAVLFILNVVASNKFLACVLVGVRVEGLNDESDCDFAD